MQSIVVILLGALVFFVSCAKWTAHATITIVSTGQRFPSMVDEDYSSAGIFHKGSKYLARLQSSGGHELCSQAQTNTDLGLLTPPDGSPIVLLVPAGGCLEWIKIQMAQDYRQRFRVPIQYLVIYDAPTPPNPDPFSDDDASSSPSPWNHYNLISSKDSLSSHHTQSQLPSGHDQQHRKLMSFQEYYSDPTALTLGALNNNNQKDIIQFQMQDEHDYTRLTPMGILRVDEMTGQELMNLLKAHGNDKITEAGGPRLILDSDGRNPTEMAFLKAMLFWLGLTLMVSGCICSFCLSLRLQEIWSQDAQQGQDQQPRRPRRLTWVQVQQLVPESQWQELEDKDDLEDGGCPSCTVYNVADENGENCCSICLDVYSPTDRVRVLPCHHTFHSECIAKWLMERSSTCPLCKLDLFPPEEESDSSSDDDDAEEVNSVDDTPPRDAWSYLVYMVRRLRRQRQNDDEHDDFLSLGPISLEVREGVSREPLLPSSSAQEQEQ